MQKTEILKEGNVFLLVVVLIMATLCLLAIKSKAQDERENIPSEISGNYGDWMLIGPGGGGQITSVAEDPNNPSNMFISINVGGVRKSVDGGATWKVVNRGFDFETRGKRAQRIMDVYVNPTNGNSILAAGLDGDIYESDDAGENWKLSYRHPGLIDEEDNIYFDDPDGIYDWSRFVIDPKDPNVVYITVGSIQKLILGVEATSSGKHWPQINEAPSAIKGTWNGSKWTWQAVGTIGINEVGVKGRGRGDYLNVYSIGVSPQNGIMFFVTEKGLYKGFPNNDGVVTDFAHVTRAGNVSTCGLPRGIDIHGGQIVFDKNNPRTAYLTLINLDNLAGVGGVYKTTNNGLNWTKLTNGLNPNSNYFDIKIDPKNSNILYVSQPPIKPETGWVNGTLYKSTDAGETWNKIVYDDQSNVVSGWEDVKIGPPNKYGIHFIHVSPTTEEVSWTYGGKLYRADNLSQQYPNWNNILTRKLGDNLWQTTGEEAIALAYSVGIDPNNSDNIYIPYGDHAYFKSNDGGVILSISIEDSEMNKITGNNFDSGTLIIDEDDSNVMYLASRGNHQGTKDGGVIYTTDGGENWVTIGGNLLGDSRGLPRGAMTDMLVEYNGTEKSLYVVNEGKSTDNPNTIGGIYYLDDAAGNGNWQRIFTMEKNAYSFAQRNDFNSLYVGVNATNKLDNPYGLYKIDKVDGNWQQVFGPQIVSGSKKYNDIETGPQSGNIYMATDKGLFVINQDDNISEINVPPFEALKAKGLDPNVLAIEIHPKNENIIYVASDKTEVLKSTDRGETWEAVSQDIPTQGFVVLKVDPNQDTIYTEGVGSGIWKRSFGEVPEL